MGYLFPEEVLENRFRLQKYLGGGGQGEVIVAWDELEEHKVAIKFQFPRNLERSLTFWEDGKPIRDEAVFGETLSGIRGIPRVLHRSPVDAPRAYFVMEFVEGLTLTQYIAAHRPIGERTAASVIGQLCEILDTVHGRGYVHRDVKPDNVIIATSGEVWLIDIGAATPIGERAHQRAGTRGYAAPEQYDKDAVLTASADIFGLGSVLLGMCLPSQPFFDLETRPQPGDQPYSDRIPINMPKTLRELGFEMIAVNPSDRPSTMREVHERLYPSLPLKGSAPPSKVTTPDPTTWYRLGRSTLF
ncbi:serine/threonine protein kinase [Actinospica durhamensis]|uniref:non-specific serine/threonine protein kinase n=1 Tax=Actinospica durhamensis TaxID=1508375 RepID=A0A941ISX6_9ACTN|nr:serine/threonine-protein kinase [Actinospica durhamensis]MBR7836922.1 serine/threonine protein kinase [Actinospica durhamensis]